MAKYNSSGAYFGERAVRWDAAGTAVTELENLGADPAGNTATYVAAINSAGVAAGTASKYDGSGNYLGESVVRWDATGTATELGNLGTVALGLISTSAWDINDRGIVVGGAYSDAAPFGLAVYWGADNLAIDLNTLIDPASGWKLERALAISNTGWIAGIGKFLDDDTEYTRLFTMHVPATAVPEPTCAALAAIATASLLRRRLKSPSLAGRG